MATDFPALVAETVPFDWATEAAALVDAEMDTDGSHDAGHLLRVVGNCERIIDGERRAGRAPDRQVILAAALLHDLVNVPKDSDDRDKASLYSARRAVEFFRGTDTFDEAQLELLFEAIETHSYSRGVPPESLEAKIVCDADRLEVLGAIGLARVFHVGGQLDRPIAHPVDPFAEDRELDDSRYAIDHFFRKLLKVRDRMRTETGRALADRRHERLVDYLRAFADEVGVHWSPETD